MYIFTQQITVTQNVWQSFQHVFNVEGVVLAPINTSGTHWELLVFFPAERIIIYLNPLGENATQSLAILHAWNIIVNKHDTEVPQGTWTLTLRPHTRQTDGHSCGVFVMEVSIYVFYIEP